MVKIGCLADPCRCDTPEAPHHNLTPWCIIHAQVKYVVELARALAQHPAVYRVDLLTRLIADPAVDSSYSEPSEVLWRAPNETGLGGAHIVRLPCGPPKTYLRCARPPGQAPPR